MISSFAEDSEEEDGLESISIHDSVVTKVYCQLTFSSEVVGGEGDREGKRDQEMYKDVPSEWGCLGSVEAVCVEAMV